LNGSFEPVATVPRCCPHGVLRDGAARGSSSELQSSDATFTLRRAEFLAREFRKLSASRAAALVSAINLESPDYRGSLILDLLR
jgi:hypothetical protein